MRRNLDILSTVKELHGGRDIRSLRHLFMQVPVMPLFYFSHLTHLMPIQAFSV